MTIKARTNANGDVLDITIKGGSIDNTAIGKAAPISGNFSDMAVTTLSVGGSANFVSNVTVSGTASVTGSANFVSNVNVGGIISATELNTTALVQIKGGVIVDAGAIGLQIQNVGSFIKSSATGTISGQAGFVTISLSAGTFYIPLYSGLT